MQIIDSMTNWKHYLQYGQRRFYQEKEVIYREDEDGADGLYYLKNGLIKISATKHSGKTSIIDIVDDDSFFGEQTVDGTIYFSSATVLEDSVVYYFSYETIVEIMQKDPQFSVMFFHCLTEKLEILSNNLLNYSLPSEKVLARTLLVLRGKFESDLIPFTQSELCKYTNLNRITVYNVFKKWEEKFMSVQNKQIHINNIEALKAISVI